MATRETRWELLLNRADGSHHAGWVRGSEADAKAHCKIVNANGTGGYFSVGKSELIYTDTEKLILALGHALWVGPPRGEHDINELLEQLAGEHLEHRVRSFQKDLARVSVQVAYSGQNWFRLTEAATDMFLEMRPDIDAKTFKEQVADLLPIGATEQEFSESLLLERLGG